MQRQPQDTSQTNSSPSQDRPNATSPSLFLDGTLVSSPNPIAPRPPNQMPFSFLPSSPPTEEVQSGFLAERSFFSMPLQQESSLGDDLRKGLRRTRDVKPFQAASSLAEVLRIKQQQQQATTLQQSKGRCQDRERAFLHSSHRASFHSFLTIPLP